MNHEGINVFNDDDDEYILNNLNWEIFELVYV